MNFDFTDRSLELQERVSAFMDRYIYPLEKEYFSYVNANPWKHFPELDNLKRVAREHGLWNLFLPKSYGDLSPGLTNLEYAPLAELMGRVSWASEVFNCSAPDTGNMEVLAKYGSDAQKEKWLVPLMAGEIRSAFLMTEPLVASSDATNIETNIRLEGDEYVINGLKWWSSGAMNPACKVFVVMGKTDPDAPRSQQQSMILVPRDAEGVNVKRALVRYCCYY